MLALSAPEYAPAGACRKEGDRSAASAKPRGIGNFRRAASRIFHTRSHQNDSCDCRVSPASSGQATPSSQDSTFSPQTRHSRDKHREQPISRLFNAPASKASTSLNLFSTVGPAPEAPDMNAVRGPGNCVETFGLISCAAVYALAVSPSAIRFSASSIRLEWYCVH